MRALIFGVLTVFLLTPAARAQTAPYLNQWHIDFRPRAGDEAAALTLAPTESILRQAIRFQDQDPGNQPLHSAAIEHSDGYRTRAKIHKIASFATLPLFAAELALGQSLYNDSTNDARRGWHAVVGASIVTLFVANTATGAWNLFGEGWDDKEGRTLRLVHGLLMIAADAGFVATTMNGPNSHSQRQAQNFEANKVTHRNLALFSISTGTVGYLIMLFGNH